MACRVFIAALLLTTFVGGCSASGGDSEIPALPAPIVTSLSTDAASVGDQVRFLGLDFVAQSDGWVDITFRGAFFPEDGTPPEDVDLTVPLAAGSDGQLTWESFGAYRVPFIESGDRTGVFEGQVFATNHLFDGTAVTQPEDTWLPVQFTVLPSLVVLDYRAVGDTWIADCRVPSPQPLHMVPYAMRVKAIGFEPYDFRYEISEGLVVSGQATDSVTSFRTMAESNEHAILTRWAPIPQHIDGYRASINVQSTGADGITREVLYTFMVRRPMQIYFRGPMQIAELYEPEPVSGCIPGGPASVETTYTETSSETRTRTIQQTIDRGWERTYGEEHQETWGASETAGEVATASNEVTVGNTRDMGFEESVTDMFSRTDGRTRVDRVDFSRTDSEEFGWMVQDETVEDFMREVGGSVTAGGEAGIPLVAQGSVSVTAQGKAGWVDGTRRREGSSGESGTSESAGVGTEEGLSVEEQRAQSRANGYHWGLSQSYQEANSFSHARSWQQTRSFGEALTHSQTLGERLSVSESELLSVSTTDTESLQTTAHVWAGMFGVWYRQTTRLVRYSSVVAYDLCGNGSEVGQIVLDDWAWAPDLGLGDECPPPTNHPDAECRVPPCSGY